MQKNNAVSRNFFELSICIFPFIWQFFNFIEKLNNYISVYVNLAHMYVCPHFSPKLLETPRLFVVLPLPRNLGVQTGVDLNKKR